ncbi:Hypothetical predicted protein [Pelobates cultripes]|uniref:Uncharacterized protein n=1 Tax=Pelobates cultripes TaxID=61616 RepID=A0AAD1S6I5_PELCU|nr:Hypothetical predicted protein [Pelobates cultripes]
MSHHKGKKNPAKAEKHNFFQQKPHSAASGLQNTTPDSDEGSDDESIAQNHPEPGEALTKGYLAQALEALSQKLIGSWKNSMDSLRRDVQEIGKRTSHIESKMEEDAAAHNDLATHVESLEEKLLLTESKLADMEDRSRRNNLPLRGVPESVFPAVLQEYVRGLLRAYAPKIPADMLLLERVPRVSSPCHLPDSSPRDVLLRAHYYHVKEHILHASRNKPKPPEDYAAVKNLL